MDHSLFPALKRRVRRVQRAQRDLHAQANPPPPVVPAPVPALVPAQAPGQALALVPALGPGARVAQLEIDLEELRRATDK